MIDRTLTVKCSARLRAVMLACWVYIGLGMTVVFEVLNLIALTVLVVVLCCCAGASWSSVDYGGVWKPVHYGVARAFADVALSVQHDLQDDTISVSPSCAVLHGSVLRCMVTMSASLWPCQRAGQAPAYKCVGSQMSRQIWWLLAVCVCVSVGVWCQ